MTLSLHEKAHKAIDPLCKETVPVKVKARIDPKDLVLAVVPIEMGAEECGAKPVTVHLRRSWIRAARP